MIAPLTHCFYDTYSMIREQIMPRYKFAELNKILW